MIGPAARQRAHDRESVLIAAVQVFNRRGYDGTRMEDLAAALGLHKSSIYHHVRSKEELLRRSLERAVAALDSTLSASCEEHGPLHRLEGLTRDVVVTMLRPDILPHVRLLLQVRGNTDVERWAIKQRRHFDSQLADMFRQAVAAGEVRDGKEPLVRARLLFGTVNSLIEWYRPGHMLPSELAEAVVDMTFDGLRSS